ncbi:hypothetical protein SAMN05660479_00928 [Microbulbifer thermotolerans]|nr:hypothetical protein SAMN05660479_00928 [Microbulbifer thermotolerans]
MKLIITRMVAIYIAAASLGWKIGSTAPGWLAESEEMLIASARENSEIPPEEPGGEPR